MMVTYSNTLSAELVQCQEGHCIGHRLPGIFRCLATGPCQLFWVSVPGPFVSQNCCRDIILCECLRIERSLPEFPP